MFLELSNGPNVPSYPTAQLTLAVFGSTRDRRIEITPAIVRQNSTPPMFLVNEHVLCFRNEKLQAAIVLKTKNDFNQSRTDGSPGQQYLIHYKGCRQM